MSWKKIALILPSSFLIAFVSYFLLNKLTASSRNEPAALRVESLGRPLTVVLENNILGKTPFYSESLKAGVGVFTLSSEERSLRTKINLVPGTLTAVNWDLGPSETFSEGEIVWLEKIGRGSVLVVFGSPEGAQVSLDEAALGVAPFSSDKISPGEHLLSLSQPGYKPRALRIKMQEGYRLSVKFQLFLLPLSAESPKLAFPEESDYALYDLSTDNILLYGDTPSWVRGLLHFLRPEARPDQTPFKSLNYYLDYQGQIFDSSGKKLSDDAGKTASEAKLSWAYLGRRDDGGLTEAAKESLLNFGRGSSSKARVEILSTGTGWLRVRSSPGLSGKEIAKVNVGEKFELIEESNGWYKIRLSAGQEGWISTSFAKKT